MPAARHVLADRYGSDKAEDCEILMPKDEFELINLELKSTNSLKSFICVRSSVRAVIVLLPLTVPVNAVRFYRV